MTAARKTVGALEQNAPDELLVRRASTSKSTWNEETREFEVTFATEPGDVVRYDLQGPFIERLSVAGLVAQDSIPFLDNHNRYSLDAHLGVVQSTWIVGREARAKVRLSRHHPQSVRLAGDLADGVRFGISCGYIVDKWKVETDPKTGQRTKTGVKWTLKEISLATIPADSHAATRGHDMTVSPSPENAPAPPAPTPEATTETTRAVPENPTTEPVQTRAAINTEIRTLGRSLSLPEALVNQLIDNEATPEAARTAALAHVVQRSQASNINPSQIVVGMDFTDPEFRARTLGEALYTRINPSHNPSEAARQYRGYSMLEMATDSLRTRGIAHSGLSPSRLVERALHSTSDFPLILGDATQRSVLASYQAATSSLKLAARQVNARDFRMRHRLKLSEGPELEKVSETGEIKAGTLVEAEESYKVETYAKRLGISRAILVNDDLGAFADISRRMGQGAAVTEAKLLAKLIEANGKLSDGKAIFHADHGNLGSGYTPWLTASPGFMSAISAARLAMRRQKTLQGNPMQVSPKFLVVPPEGETYAEQVLAEIAAATVADANPFSGKLNLLVEPYFTNVKAWYLASDPAAAAGIEWSYLEGEEGPQIDTRAGWEIEGVEIKVRLDFGAGFVDHAAWFKNPGDA